MEQTLILKTDVVAAFVATRTYSEQIASRLEVEDMVVQTCHEVSPIKWHLGHTSWLYEHFILKAFLPGYRVFDPLMELVFNSYYTSISQPFDKNKRGMLSRPTVSQVMAYRRHVDTHMQELLAAPDMQANPRLQQLLELGLNHEKQHQELMWYDIKHILFSNPTQPAYMVPPKSATSMSTEMLDWIEFDAGVRSIGHTGLDFAYDNESPQHPEWVPAFKLASRCVTNAEFKAFVEDGGYADPRWWLADGWSRVKAEEWQHPLYWHNGEEGWQEFTLYGWQPLLEAVPVSHISYYEADAFARWAGHRLPTEAEWEHAAKGQPVVDGQCNRGQLQPRAQYAQRSVFAGLFGDVWEHTQSAYLPYPGYRFINNGLGEYNGKFMSSQMVLRGGSCLSPEHHIRSTYRNFFEPGSRWQCAGIRLAQDV